MKVLAFSGAVFLLLAGCTAPPPQFEQMTEAELFAYNSTLPLMDQVYCRKQAETGTYIRKVSHLVRIVRCTSLLPGHLCSPGCITCIT